MLEHYDVENLDYGDVVYINGESDSGKHNFIGNLLKKFRFYNIYLNTDEEYKTSKVQDLVKNKKIYYLRNLRVNPLIVNSIIINKVEITKSNYKLTRNFYKKYSEHNIIFHISNNFSNFITPDIFTKFVFFKSDKKDYQKIYENIFFRNYDSFNDFNSHFVFFTSCYNCLIKNTDLDIYYYFNKKFNLDDKDEEDDDTDSLSSQVTYYTDISREEIIYIKQVPDLDKRKKLRQKYIDISKKRSNQQFKINKYLDDIATKKFEIVEKQRELEYLKKSLVKSKSKNRREYLDFQDEEPNDYGNPFQQHMYDKILNQIESESETKDSTNKSNNNTVTNTKNISENKQTNQTSKKKNNKSVFSKPTKVYDSISDSETESDSDSESESEVKTKLNSKIFSVSDSSEDEQLKKTKNIPFFKHPPPRSNKIPDFTLPNKKQNLNIGNSTSSTSIVSSESIDTVSSDSKSKDTQESTKLNMKKNIEKQQSSIIENFSNSENDNENSKVIKDFTTKFEIEIKIKPKDLGL